MQGATAQLVVRLPEDLKREVVALSLESERPVSGEVRIALRRHVEAANGHLKDVDPRGQDAGRLADARAGGEGAPSG